MEAGLSDRVWSIDEMCTLLSSSLAPCDDISAYLTHFGTACTKTSQSETGLFSSVKNHCL
jgi:hypothetical protein